MELLLLLTALLIGGAIGYYIGRTAAKPSGPVDVDELQRRLDRLIAEKGAAEGKAETLIASLRDLQASVTRLTGEKEELLSNLSRASADLRNLQERFETQKKEAEELQKRAQEQFENIANRLLEEKSRRFTQQNQENISGMLSPLRERIQEFEQKIERYYSDDNKDRAAIIERIAQLTQMSTQISEQAQGLTEALRGSSKAQGDWGEILLERVLEISGMQKEIHYKMQESQRSESGDLLRPDVVLFLPDNKNIIVDSKVSLTAYLEFTEATDDAAREAALKSHVDSVRRHIKELGAKNYSDLYKLTSLDFVLMYLPIEPAFNAALMRDASLFDDALRLNVVLVTTSTLLATLKTIESLWQMDRQSKNALEIARQSGKLYDTIVDFVKDLQRVGKKIDDARESYDDMVNRMTKRGGITSRAEKLKKLGAKATKELPEDFHAEGEEPDDADEIPEKLPEPREKE